jgi:hypothetical protein
MSIQAFVYKPVLKRDIAETVRQVLDSCIKTIEELYPCIGQAFSNVQKR